MTNALRLTVVVYAFGLGVLCVWAAMTGQLRSAAVNTGLVVLEVGVVVQALVDGLAVLQGRHPDELAVHVGYLLTSLVLVPVAWTSVRGDAGRWGSSGLAIGCLVLAVVSLRLDQTFGHA